MKNLTRKLLTVLMAVALVFTSVNTVKAVGVDDQGSLEVKGLSDKGDSVQFFQIAKVTYDGENTKLAKDWRYASDAVKADVLGLLENVKKNNASANDYESFISKYAVALKNNQLTAIDSSDPIVDTDKDGKVKWEESAANAGDGPSAGLWIAIVTPAAGNTSIYNPALLSVMYEGTNLEPAMVDLTKVYENSATVKSSNPGGDKAIKDGVVYDKGDEEDPNYPYTDEVTNGGFDEDRDWESKKTDAADGKKTVGLGDKVDYEAYIDIPEYAKEAKNKTLWFQDKMCEGLTFDSSFFTMKLVAAGKADIEVEADGDELKVGNIVVGHIKFTEGTPDGGFAVYMDYEGLREAINPQKPGKMSDYDIRLDYSAIVNEKAEIGHEGNKNRLDYAWSNNPLQGTTHEEFDEPSDTAEGIKKEYDEEIVYTYEISVLKVDEKVTQLLKDDGSIKSLEEIYNDHYKGATDKAWDELSEAEKTALKNKVFLSGAEFDVFSDAACTKKVGHIVTNGNGVATLSVVSAGTYYLKETAAPAGYAFDANVVYEVEANWTTCSYTNSSSEEAIRYTSTITEASDYNANATPQAQRVGWIKDGVFYEDGVYTQAQVDAYNEAQVEAGSDSRILPAYVKSYTVSNSSSTTTITNDASGNQGVAIKQINNSKTAVLPSTGGVGTYIFTIAGVAILATAAFMLIFRKREDA